MEQLQHFSHDHLLCLVHLQLDIDNENSDEEENEEDQVNFVMKDHHVGQCNMCKEQIYLFHTSYYKCMECDYSLHQFCAQLSLTLENHVLHPGHKLTLSKGFQYVIGSLTSDSDWKCDACNLKRKNFYNYHCSICKFSMDVICATMYKQKMDHPSHPHQLQRILTSMVATCRACGNQHTGTFYHCITCLCFLIHLDCSLLPKKLLIQRHTNETFSHSHPLTLEYFFPFAEYEAKFFPRSIVCNRSFLYKYWLYKCDKCRYYVQAGCVTSLGDSFMSILLPPGRGQTHKNFRDHDHPNLLHYPFLDESHNLVKHHFFNEIDYRAKENDGKILNHSSHQHPLFLLSTETSLKNKSVTLHDPMKRTQLLCDGCVKPITTMPFYKCCKDDQACGFVLHEWCARLPSHIQDYLGHPQHTLVLLPNNPRIFFGVFQCAICLFPSSGFAYGCTRCEYYVDVNCAFLPTEIVHEAHPNHIFSITNDSANRLSKKGCSACCCYLNCPMALHCASCDFFLHIHCALLLPKMIRHRFDKHPLSLRYYPVENHVNSYFCEICEDEFDPGRWFYHCTMCALSVHSSCAPLILQYEQAVTSKSDIGAFPFLNMKFGGTLMIEGHHPHLLEFIQGIERHGLCNKCHLQLQYNLIFKCLVCEYALHFDCALLFMIN